MQLIAIDEAGYGPRLGPLAIAATLWRPKYSSASLNGLFRSAPSMSLQAKLEPATCGYREAVDCEGVLVRVDDSKAVFRSRSADPAGRSHRTLTHVVSALQHRMGITQDQQCWRGWLRQLLLDDGGVSGLHPAIPWLNEWMGSPEMAIEPISNVSPAVDCWGELPWQPVACRARVVSADAFNRFCHPAPRKKPETAANKSRRNKSDLLSFESLRLLDSLVSLALKDETGPLLVFFDRHGGRRYYSKAIQETLAPTSIEVLEETRERSVYRCQLRGHTCWIHFTVKGDRFVPVAASSLHAKFLREAAMTAFNDHFRVLWDELKSDQREGREFKETAGYPLDADRFLSDMRVVLQNHSLPRESIVRQS